MAYFIINGTGSNFTTPGMANPNIEDLSCGSASNLSACKSSSLGLKVSTPVLMLSFGLVGNILALVVLYTSTKEVKQTVFFVLLAGLAWTDLLGQTMTGPIAIAVYANNLKWVGGKPLCIFHAICMVLFSMLTPLLVLAMSLERLLALKFTYFYGRNINRRRARFVVIGCWILVLFFCTFPLMGLGSFELQFPGSWCYLNYHKESATDVIYASIFGSLNSLFIFINLLCNIAVVITLLQMRQKRKLINSPSIKSRNSSTRSKSRSGKPETYMILFLCSITIVFSTCHLPLNVNILINQITGRKNITMDLLSIRFASINQILDPWLYILLRKAFLFKMIKQIKKWICDKGSQLTPKRFSYGKGSKESDKGNTYRMEQIPSFQIHVISNKLDDAGSDVSNGSDDSHSSVSRLIPNTYTSPGKETKKHRPPFLRSMSDTEGRDFQLRSTGSDDSGVFNDDGNGNFFLQTKNHYRQNLSKSEKPTNIKRDPSFPQRMNRQSSSPAIIPLPVMRRQSNI